MVKRVTERLAYWSRNNFYVSNLVKKIREAEGLSGEELEALKRKAFIGLVKKAKASSPFYKALYSSVSLQGSFEEIYQRLPVIHKEQVRENGKKIASAPLWYLKKAHTSGTSGSPLEIMRSPVAMMKENAYVWYYRMAHGLNPGDPLISMRGHLDNTTFKRFNSAENTLYLSSYQLSKNNIRQYADVIREFKPKAIAAFPSSVFSLVNLLEEAGLSLEIPLVFTSSETLYPFQREKIEQHLKARIFDWYGNAERSIALGECEHGNYHELPLYGYYEFTDKGVITTSLINTSFPLIKYYVDDTFKLMNNACACGRGVGVSTVEGRMDDVVKLPDGTRVGRLGVAFQGVGHLRYAQIIQEEIGKITVNMVVAPGFGSNDENLLKNKLRQRLNESLDIEFAQIDEKDIIKTKSGKFKLIVSSI